MPALWRRRRTRRPTPDSRFRRRLSRRRAGDRLKCAARIAAGRFAVRFAIGTTGRAGLVQPVLEPSLGSERLTQLWGTERRSHHHGYFRQRRPERQRYPARPRLSRRHSEQRSGLDCRYCHCCCDHRCVCVRIQQFRRPPRSRANPRRGASSGTVGDPSAAGGSQFPYKAVTGVSESPPSKAGSYSGFRRSRRRIFTGCVAIRFALAGERDAQATPRNKPANSPPVIASAAKQSRGRITRPLDCFVARAPRNDGRGISVQSIRQLLGVASVFRLRAPWKAVDRFRAENPSRSWSGAQQRLCVSGGLRAAE